MTEAGSPQSSSGLAALPGIARILGAGSHHQLYRSLRPAGLRLLGSLTVSAILGSSPHSLIESLDLYRYQPSRQRNPEISRLRLPTPAPAWDREILNVYQCHPSPFLFFEKLNFYHCFGLARSALAKFSMFTNAIRSVHCPRENSAFINVSHPPNSAACKATRPPVNNLLGGSGTDGNHSA